MEQNKVLWRALLLSNVHPHAREVRKNGIQWAEQKLERLGSLLLGAQPPYQIRRVGSALHTLRGGVSHSIPQEVAHFAAGVDSATTVLAVLSVHCVLLDDRTLAVAPRDVPIEEVRDVAIPIDDLLGPLVAREPAHLFVVLECAFLEDSPLTSPQVLATLPVYDCSHTLVVGASRYLEELGAVSQLETTLSKAWRSGSGEGVTLASVLSSLWGGRSDGIGHRLALRTTVSQDTQRHLRLLGPMRGGMAEWSGDELVTVDERSADTLKPGVMLPGRIRVGPVIGVGGFGTVYKGLQCDLNRPVAIKVLQHRDHASTEDARLFMREMKTVAMLQHRNIVSIFQPGVGPGGRMLYVMELLEGESLRRYLDQGREFSHEMAVDVTCQVLTGLAHAHKRGIIHGDIKPENLMLVPDDQGRIRVVILDFGIARWKEEFAKDSGTFAAGTPGYSPKEQMDGGRVDETADIFAAGVCLVEMLSSLRPCDLTDPSRLDEELQRLEVPPRIRNAALEAVHDDPQRRFPTVQQFLEVLQGKGHEYSDERARRVRLQSPFRHLSPFTESDAPLFFGRDEEVRRLFDKVLFAVCTLVTGVAGVGKTSLLQAGIMSYCNEMDIDVHYVSCQEPPLQALIAKLSPGAEDLQIACLRRYRMEKTRLCLVIDQLELMYGDSSPGREVVEEFEIQLARVSRNDHLELSIILCIRDDSLARASELRRRLGISVYHEFQVLPMRWAEARQAIVLPLRIARLGVSEALLEQLKSNLSASHREISGSRNPDDTFVHPAHLELACSLLYDELQPTDGEMNLSHYERIGGIRGILTGHLQRTLDNRLEPQERAAARRIIESLITPQRTRVAKSVDVLYRELVDKFTPRQVDSAVQELQQARALHTVQIGGQWRVELAHESLVELALDWAGRQDVEWRRQADLLRMHLHQSTTANPVFLTSRELKKALANPAVIDEVDGELEKLPGTERPEITAAKLVKLSRSRLRRRTLGYGGAALSLVVILALTAFWQFEASVLQRNDVGLLYVDLAVVEVDSAGERKTVAPEELESFEVSLHQVDLTAIDPVGKELSGDDVSLTWVELHGERVLRLESPRGAGALVVTGRNRKGEAPCRPSVLVLSELPGFAQRQGAKDPERVLHLTVPTCDAGKEKSVPIPGGSWKESRIKLGTLSRSVPRDLPSYRLDRTEVSRDDLRDFLVQCRKLTPNHSESSFPIHWGEESSKGEHPLPATGLDWFEARSYCLSQGKDLPSVAQWIKGARGGSYLDGDATARIRNPSPERRFPWGEDTPVAGEADRVAFYSIVPEASHPVSRLLPVDSAPLGQSPYGILHMSGNAEEWVKTPPRVALTSQEGREFSDVFLDSGRMVFGGCFESTSLDELRVDSWKILDPWARDPQVGFRCVEEPPL